MNVAVVIAVRSYADELSGRISSQRALARDLERRMASVQADIEQLSAQHTALEDWLNANPQPE